MAHEYFDWYQYSNRSRYASSDRAEMTDVINAICDKLNTYDDISAKSGKIEFSNGEKAIFIISTKYRNFGLRYHLTDFDHWEDAKSFTLASVKNDIKPLATAMMKMRKYIEKNASKETYNDLYKEVIAKETAEAEEKRFGEEADVADKKDLAWIKEVFKAYCEKVGVENYDERKLSPYGFEISGDCGNAETNRFGTLVLDLVGRNVQVTIQHRTYDYDDSSLYWDYRYYYDKELGKVVGYNYNENTKLPNKNIPCITLTGNKGDDKARLVKFLRELVWTDEQGKPTSEDGVDFNVADEHAEEPKAEPSVAEPKMDVNPKLMVGRFWKIQKAMKAGQPNPEDCEKTRELQRYINTEDAKATFGKYYNFARSFMKNIKVDESFTEYAHKHQLLDESGRVSPYIIDCIQKEMKWDAEDITDFLNDHWSIFVKFWNKYESVLEAFKETIRITDEMADYADELMSAGGEVGQLHSIDDLDRRFTYNESTETEDEKATAEDIYMYCDLLEVKCQMFDTDAIFPSAFYRRKFDRVYQIGRELTSSKNVDFKNNAYIGVDKRTEKLFNLEDCNMIDTTRELLGIIKQFSDVVVPTEHIEESKMDEDFGMGVAEVGADQGIPHGGDCKAVNPMPMGFPTHRRPMPPRPLYGGLFGAYMRHKKKKKLYRH